MNNQFPFQHGYDGEKRYPDDPAQLLEELARIRQEIEQDSAGSFRNRPDDKPLSCSKTENSVIFESILNSSDLNQSHSDSAQSPQCGEFRSFYRFDSEHIDGVSQFDDNEPAYKSDSTPSSLPVLPPLFPSEQEAWPEQARENKVVAKSENAQNRRRFDQAPMIIPIHGPQHSKDSKGRQSSKRAPQQGNRQKTTKYGEYCDDSYSNFTTPPMLPWHSFSQYENETFFKLVANASSFSLFIGWGAVACGVLVFARSFFVGSMVWLNYGLPVLSLGAVCLFLGILLSILAEKMQQINELKQSLTVQRITGKSNLNVVSPRGSDSHINEGGSKSTNTKVSATTTLPQAESSKKKSERKDSGSRSTPITSDTEESEVEEIYDRLIKLRSEINELINECEGNPLETFVEKP